jgi:pimeloyl-ACP methyl ester carboxylesterase
MAQAPPLWGTLTPGPYTVGFRSEWKFDPSRTYQTTLDDKTSYAVGKAPRPVLVNVWYPAERSGDAPSMPHGEYFAIGSEDTRLHKFAAMLANYEREVVGKEIFGDDVEKWTEQQRRLLDRLWTTPTACVRDARPLERTGPVVVYHSGARSSFEDNSVLCEFLASHGYVVIGSAFQQAWGETLNIDGLEGSARDLAFLIAYASQLSFADWGHVAVAGHSAGAQAALMYASRGSTPVDAVVSLDTTQDYASLADHDWSVFVPVVQESARNMTMPILFAANAHAVFELADSLGDSERDYLTFHDLDHNDFISQGIFKRILASWADMVDRKANSRPSPAPGSTEASYEALCEYVLAFLDAHLRSDPARREALDATYRRSPLGGPVPHVDHVPVCVTTSAPYVDNSGNPPEPRQVRGLLHDRGPEATVAILKAAHEKAPDAPVFHEDVAFALIDGLLAKGQTPDAAAVHQLYGSFDPEFRKRLVQVGKSSLKYGMKTRALEMFEKAVLLDPDDAEAAQQAAALRSAAKAR